MKWIVYEKALRLFLPLHQHDWLFMALKRRKKHFLPAMQKAAAVKYMYISMLPGYLLVPTYLTKFQRLADDEFYFFLDVFSFTLFSMNLSDN